MCFPWNQTGDQIFNFFVWSVVSVIFEFHKRHGESERSRRILIWEYDAILSIILPPPGLRMIWITHIGKDNIMSDNNILWTGEISRDDMAVNNLLFIPLLHKNLIVGNFFISLVSSLVLRERSVCDFTFLWLLTVEFIWWLVLFIPTCDVSWHATQTVPAVGITHFCVSHVVHSILNGFPPHAALNRSQKQFSEITWLQFPTSLSCCAVFTLVCHARICDYSIFPLSTIADIKEVWYQWSQRGRGKVASLTYLCENVRALALTCVLFLV